MLNLRRAKREDKKQILDISRTIWDGDDYIPNIVDKWIKDEEGEFTVAQVDGIIKGFAKFTVLSPGEFWLEGIRVDRNSRGLGMGKEITKYFIQKAKQMNFKLLGLSTYVENYESISIIERYNFKKATSFKFFYKSGDFDINNESKFEKVTDFRDVLYILHTKEMKSRNNYLSFDWTFMKVNERLLKELVKEGYVYVLRENGVIKSTIILSDKMCKGNELSINYIDGEGYYEKGIKFALTKCKEGKYDALSFMCPDIEEIKRAANKEKMGTFGDYSTDVFVYEYKE